MKLFEVVLNRTYAVRIKADNEKKAKFLDEFYLSTPIDSGDEREHGKYNYEIIDADLNMNEALDYCEEFQN